MDQRPIAPRRPLANAPAVAGGLLLIAALIIMIGAALFADRANSGHRDELSARLEPFAAALARVQLNLAQSSADTRGYALTGNPEFIERYAAATTELQLSEQQMRDLVPAEFSAESEAAITATRAWSTVVGDQTVAAAQRGDTAEAQRLVATQGPELLDAARAASGQLDNDVAAKTQRLRDRIDTVQNREKWVLLLTGSLGAIAAALLLTVVLRNRALAGGLDDERQRLRDIVGNVPGVVWEAWGQPDRASQRIDFVSEHVEAMLGYTVQEWLSTPNFWLTIVHPSDKERAAAEATAIFASGGSGTSQFRWVARDGHIVWVLAHSAAIKDASGAPAGMRGVNLDITERIRIEDLQRFTAEATRQLSASLDYDTTLASVARLAVPDIADWCSVHVVGDDGLPRQVALEHADPRKVELARRMQTQYPPDPDARFGVPEVIRSGKPEMVSVITDEMLVAIAQDAEQLRIARTVGYSSYLCVPMIARGRTLGAITMVAEQSGRHFSPDDLSVAEDLARRAAVAVDNAALYNDAERERARFLSIVSSAGYGIYQIDAAGRVVYANPAAEEALGFGFDDVRGRSMHEIVHPDDGVEDGDDGTCQLRAALASRSEYEGDDAFTCADGSKLPVSVRIDPIRTATRTIGAVVAFQDSTDRIRREAMKDDFIAFASHELRNPLTSVKGFSRWLARQAAAKPEVYDEDTRDAIDTLVTESDRMDSIIELFLDLTRIDSDRLAMTVDVTDLCEVIDDEATAFRTRHPDIELAVDVPDAEVEVETDADRVRQVITNLLENAAKYGGDVPSIRLTLAVDDAAATISVADSGQGISRDDQRHVFDRFFRSKTPDTAGKKGLGVGLFVSREIVERLGGTLTLASEPGEGATFTVRIPRHPAGRT